MDQLPFQAGQATTGSVGDGHVGTVPHPFLSCNLHDDTASGDKNTRNAKLVQLISVEHIAGSTILRVSAVPFDNVCC